MRYLFAICVFCFSLLAGCSAYRVVPDKDTYRRGDKIYAFMAETVQSDGACAAKPMYGLMVKRDTGWAEARPVPAVKLACGLGYIPGGHSYHIFTNDGRLISFDPGEYKLVLMSEKWERLESGSFFIEN